MSSSAQLMRQAETVKATLTDPSKALSESWGQRQKLEDLYKQLLLHDLEYALDKKVEQELWNHAFKNQISTLQNQAKDRMSLKKTEARANLNLFLEMASGFYLQFLQMICSTFKLDLPFRRRSSAFGITNENRIHDTSIVLPKKSSCLYICCHCLVHLGDIARYLQQTEQAQNYYRHAANLSPNNGQPYNQLAILEASRGDKLSTVFYYVRSLAVRHPFPVAATNLEKLYSKLIKDARDFDSPNLSVAEITVAFLQFQALLHMSTNFDRASGLRLKITSSVASHIKAQSLTAAHLTGIVAISIFALHRARNDTSDAGEPVKKVALSKDEEQTVQLHVGFFAKLLETLLQHTPKEDSKVREFLTLPAIKVCFDWLSLNRDVLKGREFSNTSLWQDMCKLLNTVQWLLNDNNKVPDPSKYAETPLPEDVDLRCFQPLDASYGQLNFARAEKEELSATCERDLRCHKLVAHGKWVAQDLTALKFMVYQSDKSIRNQFSSQKTGGGSEGLHATPAKSNRQNVAMQTILKKQMERKAEEEKNAMTSPLQDIKTKTANTLKPDGAGGASTVSRQDSSGSGGGRQGGVIPVQHHKGGTFKPNLPPRLAGKNKPAPSVSPRLQKKNESGNFFTSPPAGSSMSTSKNQRNKISSITTTMAPQTPSTSTGGKSAAAKTPTQAPPPPPPGLDSEVDYPKLSLDNYPALVGGKSAAASLIVPGAVSSTVVSAGTGRQSNSANSSVNVSVNSQSSGWGSFGVAKIEPELVSGGGGDQAGVGGGHLAVMRSAGGEAAVSSGDAFSSLYQHHQQQPPSTSPRSPSSYVVASGIDGRPKVVDDPVSKIGVMASNDSNSNQGYTSAFSMQGPLAFLSSATSGNSPRQINTAVPPPPPSQQQQQQQMLHQEQMKNLMKQHQQQQQQQQQQQYPRYPPQTMSNNNLDFFSQPQAGGMKYDQKQQHHQQHLASLMYENPAAAGLLSSGHPGMQDSGQRGLFPNSAMTGIPSSGFNPQTHRNQKQQQQQQMHHQQQHQSQRQQNQQPPPLAASMDTGGGDPMAPSGLLYKNIPLPGNSRAHATTSDNNSSGPGISALAGKAMNSSNKSLANQMPGQAVANQMRGQQAGNGMMGTQPATQMQASQALAQLMGLNRGLSSHSSQAPADLYRSPINFQPPTKPDLMGLQPPPSFLEQHQHDRGYKSSPGHHHQQQPSFLNTMMDPSFLQATGEYSLFNNSINNNSSNNSSRGNNNNSSNNNSMASNPGWLQDASGPMPPHGSGVRGSAPPMARAAAVPADLNPSLQALWQTPGPSPLERLLEQQRHHRHNEG